MVILKYLIIINIIASGLFIIDKIKAQHGYRRIPEFQLHALALFGGIFSMLPLMHFIRHKNQKTSYVITSFLILLIWVFLIFQIWVF